MTAVRVLVVDDTITYRRAISDVLADFADVDVVGTANTASVALAKIRALRPDLITLDQEMPEMTGLELLRILHREFPDIAVIMVSSHTPVGGKVTIEALQAGAFGFVTKPSGGGRDEMTVQLRSALRKLLDEFARKAELRSGADYAIRPPVAPAGPPLPASALPHASVEPVRAPSSSLPNIRVKLVLIGISTGGPNALAQLIPALPANLGVPVLIVQHMPPQFTAYLAQSLDAKSPLHVKEAEDEEPIRPNCVYIAPGGQHLKIRRNLNGDAVCQLSDDPPEQNCRPSVDVLFRSASHCFPGSCCALIMTGMGRDGTLGLRLLKRQGAFVIAQDAASSVIFGMPGEAIEAGVVDRILPLSAIAEAVVQAVKSHG